MIDPHPALGNGIGERPGESYVNRNHARRSKIRIERLDQFQVYATLGSHIEDTFSGEVDDACSRDVGIVPHHVELVNLERLVGN